MGLCTSKPSTDRSIHVSYPQPDPPVVDGGGGERPEASSADESLTSDDQRTKERAELENVKKSPFFPFYSPSPAHYFFSKKSPARSPAPSGPAGGNGTPKRFFKRPFPPPSPAKHIRAVLARRHGSVKPNEASIPEGSEVEGMAGLDKSFGFSKHFGNKYELGDEVGRGHFGYTCAAKFKKGELKGQQVAVKVIPKVKMTTAIAIEDVRREVKILRALTGHNNLVQFYDAYEDSDNVYIVMELCEGGELLDRILSRYFLNTADERLNDIVGSAYYVAPEVLHRSYGTEADVWSIGVIAYILLCGSRPFWARTESGIFRAVLKADPSFDEAPWPSMSPEARDFVKRLLNKDPRKRITAAQALSHPWIKSSNDVIKVPLDIIVFKLMKAYMRSSSLRKAALRALSKTLTVDELFFLKEQFALLEPNKNGTISLDNIKSALMKHATDAMKESRIPDFLASLNALQYRRMDFEEFCAAALSVHQLEALDRWEQHARCAYELFDKDGNRAIMIEELASVCFLHLPAQCAGAWPQPIRPCSRGSARLA
ncbi:unnamed protein product [Linum tenue]|uniref:non-specific serine/threonine protein kinase n=1 Tax=Linum tenue TaxID=586396 RepID=A0AAV0R901_9ROSI|nr:unnamed protein product [Linum tenue]